MKLQTINYKLHICLRVFFFLYKFLFLDIVIEFAPNNFENFVP